ncbi:unnamed protein product [Brassicogethes aeneus]|uniref:Uncharacterized protein n=1 Tax=Brassicogethes aeneus TaxID=1431903 RepID=A0A9P0BEZ7_BRAAE|nr:unnamed protein product [Brassicogethes aeneus]
MKPKSKASDFPGTPLKHRAKIILKRLKEESDLYCQETTLHGLHYITSRKSTRLQSIIWLALCTVGMAFCVYFINEQLMRYNNNRVTTNVGTTAYSIYDVPFPSVTICNINVVYANNTDKIEKIIEGQIPKADIADFFFNLSTLVLNDNLYGSVGYKSYEKITNLLEEAGYSTDKIMKILAQPCDSLLLECKWNDTVRDCSTIFRTIKTTYGFCCSFNYKGVADDDPSSMTNIYVTGVGSTYGLEVTLNVAEDQYVSALKPYYGIQVAIHEAYQYPDLVMASSTIFPGFKQSYGLSPKIVSSNDELRVINSENRGCLFYNEREMHWSGRYSFSSCINECRLRAIMTICECVPYYYPLENVTRFCTILDSKCLKSSAGYYSEFDEQTPERMTKSMRKCKCLPQCNEISYSYHTESHPSSEQM